MMNNIYIYIYIKMFYGYICQTLFSIQLDSNLNIYNYVVLFLKKITPK
jgi:hypothetical protein